MRYVMFEFDHNGMKKQMPVLFPEAMPEDMVKSMVEGAGRHLENMRIIAAGITKNVNGHVSCQGFDEQFKIGCRGRVDEVLIQSADEL